MNAKLIHVEATWSVADFYTKVDFDFSVNPCAKPNAIRQLALELLLSRLSLVGVFPDGFSINVREAK